MIIFGYLELEVDVEFVDIFGRGDEKGNQFIDIELSNVDVVLFFEEGKLGRLVLLEDIVYIFCRFEEVQFILCLKFVYFVNDRLYLLSEIVSDYFYLL